MESPALSKAVLELGKRLVTQLNLGDDLLAQWMAHDIAARIDAVDRASPDTLQSSRDVCAKSILALWEHRNQLPEHIQVFRELDPMIRTLVSLDVENGDDYRYFRTALREAAADDTDTVAKEWLELAFGIDYSARVLIQFALRSAGANSAVKSKSWVEAAMSAGLEDFAERHVVEFISTDSRDKDDAQNVTQEGLRDKIAKLESFARLASALAAELQGKLEPSQSTEDDKSVGLTDKKT